MSTVTLCCMRNLLAACRATKTAYISGHLRKYTCPQLYRTFSTRPTVACDRKFTVEQLRSKYKSSEPITAITAYDYPSAKQVDVAGIDIALVGDSAAMVVHGHDTTLPITLDDMITHARSVKRAVRRAMIVGDLPFGTYEESPTRAVCSALRMIKDGGADAVKLEGAIEPRLSAIRSIKAAGIPVMGHIGLTPQSINALGGFKPQGRNADGALNLVENAMRLEEAGCFAVVVECVPEVVTLAIRGAIDIPIIGIGAGRHADGQILVYHDILGLTVHPHHAKVSPRFCKQYAQLGDDAIVALETFKHEVVSNVFPGAQFCPYVMGGDELNNFVTGLQKLGLKTAAEDAKDYL
ncbi:Ketopantoate hydroxymethyltransferase [Ostreococcus tauri]|uniref:3-methyl-2-oxobutanoate hydroxymethyltransferase n=1 Tax=Ostreococcus tauri TaxID=70448 RepID=A0A090MBT7_OSTTA|nr:Ketopantoate hydroxymethyltransferase [Ostreococcus tauri]CEG01044.1 Ketopantoate hydroxymethyltransferase [Ostreococcus tauri]|eukprot:XP_022840761.1 Ketopantoate hydroxymethyltransferase [Ostreococcus tauri]